MTKAKLASAAFSLALAAGPASAATISSSQPVLVGGDLAIGDPENINIFLPSFDPALGTLLSTTIGVAGVLQWAEPFGSVADPGPLETIQTGGMLLVLDEADNIIGGQSRTGPTFRAASTQSVGGTLGFNVIGALPVGDDSAYVNLDPTAFALCTGCQVLDIGDTTGTFTGTLTTTFRYLPVGASIPEPASWALLVVGLVGIGAIGRRSRT